MLKKKVWRDIKENKSQFITIFLMVLIGVMVYVGIEAYIDGMTKTATNFYTNYNLQDLNVLGMNFTQEDLSAIKEISNVNNAERKLVINAFNAEDTNKSFLVSFIESNEISKFYIVDGLPFDVSKSGVWLDNFYAEENNLKVGDTIKIQYDTFTLEEEIIGLINVPDHLYDVKDESQLLPNRENYGFVYLSIQEFPEENIPYNYIMVDVNSQEDINSVKETIEETIENAIAVIKIEDTSSYAMYQSEIEEGSAFVGIFSGLFLFIAMLSTITTMTRVVKKQKLQIGTLKALGFKKRKIILHYVSFGFIVSLFGSLAGILAGRYFIGSIFMGMEMQYFEIPNGHPIIQPTSYLMAILVVLGVSFITYLTCRKELLKSPADSLRMEIPKVKNKELNLTSKGIFNKLNFSAKWNLRDILRNKFRTITGLVGITGCCMLIVCAFGMLNSMNYFIELQFEELYNFDYKLNLKENCSEEDIQALTTKYGNATSKTLGIEIKEANGTRTSNTIFVTDAKEYIRFQDNKKNFITLTSKEGVYVTYKLAQTNNYHLGDTISWHIYGDNNYYTSPIVGFNKDPQNQNITMTKEYLESLGISYIPDTIYTNEDLSNENLIESVDSIQDITDLENSIRSMLDMMKSMIIIIIVFAILLGAVIIYNMGILSFSEKVYQFATLKVLGFKDKQIAKIYIKQNTWITLLSILIGLPTGYYLTSWLFKACLDDTYDFSVSIHLSTYLIASLGTFLVSYLVSYKLARKIKKIDMVSSLKGNE